MPLALAFLNGLVFLLRGALASLASPAGTSLGDDPVATSFTAERRAEAAAKRFREHVSVFLLGSYLVLPSVGSSHRPARDRLDLGTDLDLALDLDLGNAHAPPPIRWRGCSSWRSTAST